MNRVVRYKGNLTPTGVDFNILRSSIAMTCSNVDSFNSSYICLAIIDIIFRSDSIDDREVLQIETPSSIIKSYDNAQASLTTEILVSDAREISLLDFSGNDIVEISFRDLSWIDKIVEGCLVDFTNNSLNDIEEICQYLLNNTTLSLRRLVIDFTNNSLSISAPTQILVEQLLNDRNIEIEQGFTVLRITTNIDLSLGGSYFLQITSVGSDILWVFPNLETSNLDTASTTDGGLDGQDREITVTLNEPEEVQAVNFNGKALEGDLDLSPLTFDGIQLFLSNNPGIDNLNLEGVRSAYYFLPNVGGSEIVVNGRSPNSTRLRISQCGKLKKLIFREDILFVSQFDCSSLVNLQEIVIESNVLDPSNLGTVTFANGGFSAALINSLAKQLYETLEPTIIGTVINLTGNSAPDTVSGGIDGVFYIQKIVSELNYFVSTN